jgi:hypothetical protein
MIMGGIFSGISRAVGFLGRLFDEAPKTGVSPEINTTTAPATEAQASGTPQNTSTALSTHRFTSEGESSLRYESDALEYSRIGEDGSVAPGTFAAPATDGVQPQPALNGAYNLPNPEIPRTNVTEIKPPAGTLVVGPRSVQGGTGNEVIYVNGAPPGSAGPRQPVPPPPPPPPPEIDPLKKH